MQKMKIIIGSIVLTLLSLCWVQTSLANGSHMPKSSGVIYLTMGKGKLFYYHGAPKTIFIGDPSLADFVIKSQGIIYLTPKKVGKTNIIGVGEDHHIVFKKTVIVRLDTSGIRSIIRRAAPYSNVRVEAVKDSVVLRGTVLNPSQAANIVEMVRAYLGKSSHILNFMKVRSPTQIYLRVRVVEMSRNVGRVLGVNWRSIYRSGRFAGGGTFGNVTNALINNITGGGVTGGAGGSLLASYTNPGDGFNFNAVLDALEQRGLATMLAEPNLTTMSGTSADFLAGGEFPIPVGQGLGAVSVSFRRFGVNLNFTPTIVNGSLINLKIKTEVSTLSSQGAVSFNGFQIPGLTNRSANVTVELHSGQSFAIAGLLQKNIQKMVSKFPILGDIPIIGQLFRSKSFEKNQSELVIVVTPYFVRATGPNKLAVPTDGLPNRLPPPGANPSDKQFGLLVK